ncbi:MAG: hypothetical protein H6747_10655 [Deltaproteobacteria bacterium]|nr:hypothetical protein [Deltaproteobacteria bacterium]
MLGKLLRKLGGGEAPRLEVEGVVIETGRHQPRTHLGPQQPAEEAYVGLEIASARLSDGRVLAPAQVVPAEFSGPVALLAPFEVGAKVQIVCSTLTGREIAEIRRSN